MCVNMCILARSMLIVRGGMCSFIYLYIHMCVCMEIYMYIHVCIYDQSILIVRDGKCSIYVYVYMYIWTHICTCTYL